MVSGWDLGEAFDELDSIARQAGWGSYSYNDLFNVRSSEVVMS